MAEEATYAVSNALRGIENSLRSLENRTVDLTHNVSHLSGIQEVMHDDLAELRLRFEEFVLVDRRQKNVQLAETKIIKTRQALEREFGHYEDLRRLATGVLQAAAEHLVSDDAIQGTTEEEMMKAPRYWLAPSLVMVAAWLRDDEVLAARAADEALNRDSSKSSLFIALVMRRDEQDAAALWIQRFFKAQDPRELRREFVVILDAIAAGAFGPASVETSSEVLSDWIDGYKRQDDTDERLASEWRSQLQVFKSQQPHSYTVLAESSPIWPDMESSLQLVRAHRSIGEHFTNLFAEEITFPRDLEDRVDDLLTSLVSNFDVEELPLRREELHLQAMIDSGGDEEAAEEAAKRVDQTLDEVIDFPTLLANAAMHPTETGASQGTQRLATAMSRDWIVGAHDQLTAGLRHDVIMSVPLVIDGWAGVADATNDDSVILAELEADFDKKTQEAADEVKLSGLAVGAGVLGVVLLLIGLVNLNAVAIVIGLAGMGFAYWSHTQLDSRRAEVLQAWSKRKVSATQKCRDALAELVDYRIEWATEDDEAETTRNLLLNIEAADFGLATPAIDR